MNISKSTELTVTSKVRFGREAKGALRLHLGDESEAPAAPTGRVPKLSRLMALAIRFQGLLERGEVKDFAELARLGHVTRARVTQIMNLLMLAPDIQEKILFMPKVEHGKDPLREWEVRPIAAELYWGMQRRMCRGLVPLRRESNPGRTA